MYTAATASSRISARPTKCIMRNKMYNYKQNVYRCNRVIAHFRATTQDHPQAAITPIAVGENGGPRGILDKMKQIAQQG